MPDMPAENQSRRHHADSLASEEGHGGNGHPRPASGAHEHAHPHQKTKAVVNRLSKIIGHLDAVRRMVEEGRDCSEVLIQLAAVRAAINGTCKLIIRDHIDNCIVDAIETGDSQAIEELNRAIELLMR